MFRLKLVSRARRWINDLCSNLRRSRVKLRRQRWRFLFFFLIAVIVETAGGAEPDYIEAEAPAPDSATQVKGSLAHGLKPRDVMHPAFPSFVNTCGWRIRSHAATGV